jgi:putative ABC transport system permease protein
VKTLDKKLRRDLAHMKGQAITIGLVMACGVAALVAALTTYDSLRWSQQTYYEAAHFPQVFVSLKRAPAALTAHLAALPGVIDVEPRVVFDVMLDVAGVAAPPIGRMIALPEHGMPRMNRLHLRQGRWVEPGHGNEVLVSEGFAKAHQLRPGSRVRTLLNGKYQVLEIAGVVLTPEYIFAIRSGRLLPDDRQFGVFWIAHTTLAAAFNMEGTFNDVVLRLAPGTRVPSVLEALDQLLAPYGSLGAYSRSEQMASLHQRRNRPAGAHGDDHPPGVSGRGGLSAARGASTHCGHAA